jgi:hypothetical protein
MNLSETVVNRLCAEAMGYNAQIIEKEVRLTKAPIRGFVYLYDPFNDLDQAAHLLEAFHLHVTPPSKLEPTGETENSWIVHDDEGVISGQGRTLASAIARCVAMIRIARTAVTNNPGPHPLVRATDAT